MRTARRLSGLILALALLAVVPLPSAPTASANPVGTIDGDGKIDFPDDADCTDAGDNDEFHYPECSDGVDNDDDGLVDFFNDPDCSDFIDDSECAPPVTPQCSDGSTTTVTAPPTSPPTRLHVEHGQARERPCGADGRLIVADRGAAADLTDVGCRSVPLSRRLVASELHRTAGSVVRVSTGS